MARILITGIAGQDGSYLAESVARDGHEVFGTVRKDQSEASAAWTERLAGGPVNAEIREVSVGNRQILKRLIREIRPDYCYHLAGQSLVRTTIADEARMIRNMVEGTHTLLSAIREWAPACRFVHASSSEVFGEVSVSPQDETCTANPRSIYGVAKLSADHLIRYYRAFGGLHASSAILYNHESPRRQPRFVTRKITLGAARIKLGLEDSLALGNLDVHRDWGYAPDYVDAMRRIAEAEEAGEYVVATGVTHTVRDLVDTAFRHVGLDYCDHVVTDSRFYAPAEAVPLRGDSAKLRQTLGWRPRKAFHDIVREMVDADLAALSGNRRDVAGAAAH